MAIRYFGDYVLLGEIARGGMGVVYRARQVSLNRPVAVKMILPGQPPTPAQVQRFRTEAEAAAGLDHPNIVPIYEIGEHEGQPYFSMKLIEGHDLAHQMGGRPMPPQRAAQILASVARAVHHAHQRGVLHRDLKPSNIVLERADSEQPVPLVTDFGLAKLTERGRDLSQTGGLLGTLEYIAPEQASGKTRQLTTAADIYSLGAILFAVLTGRPPFQCQEGEGDLALLQRVKEAEPPRPRSLNPACPPDLEVICLKCLEKEPVRRYGSAEHLAEDLDRFLEGSPISARPVGGLERLWIWCRRHPVHARLVLAVALAVLALTVAGFVARNAAQARRENEALLLLREATLERLVGFPKKALWRSRAVAKVQSANALASTRLYRDQVVVNLEGLDAVPLTNRVAFHNRQLAFDAAGNTLFLAGATNTESWVMHEGTLQPTAANRGHPGHPIAFPSGAALQLVRSPSGELVVWQSSGQRTLCRLRIPAGLDFSQDESSIVSAASRAENLLALGLTNKQGDPVVALWRLPSGELLRAVPAEAKVTALEISADGAVTACGTGTGTIHVWDSASGGLLDRLSLSRLPVTALALAPGLDRTKSREDQRRNVVLAAGNSGGSIGIWDLGDRRIQAICPGSHYDVFALAFSPDGQTLAAGGRGPVRLWDAVTGWPLLDFDGDGDGSYCDALAFGLDGLHLAASKGKNPLDRQVKVWELQNGRGVATLGGLSSSVTKVIFSPHGDRLAAVGMGWEVGVWNRAQQRLLHVIEAPRGFTADNCAVAFSFDGQQMAIAAGNEAQLWHATSGRHLHTWKLPPGLVDAMAFNPDGGLFLLRVETLQGTEMRLSDAPWRQYPRVCRLRRLTPSEETPAPLLEITDFNVGLFTASASWDGNYFAIEGLCSTNGNVTRKILAIHAPDGRTVWQATSTNEDQWARNPFSSSGAHLAYTTDGLRYQTVNLARPSEAPAPLAYPPAALGPQTSLGAKRGDDRGGERGLTVFEDGSPRVTLGLETAELLGSPAFDPSGRWLAWGNPDGTVSLCDLEEVRAQLKRSRLTW
jgi:WD40 repeat protein